MQNVKIERFLVLFIQYTAQHHMSTSCLTDWLSQKETQQVANATTVTSLKNQILSQHELLVLKKEAKILKKSFHFWFLEIYFSKIFFIYCIRVYRQISG